MNPLRRGYFLLPASIALAGTLLASAAVHASDGSPSPQAAPAAAATANLEMQIYLLVASDEPSPESAVPAELAAVSKRLQSQLQVRSCRLASTFLHRFADSGNLRASGVIPPMLPIHTSEETPGFFNLSVDALPSRGTDTVSLDRFDFGLRMPIVTGMTSNGPGAQGVQIQYENVGVSSSRLSFVEGQPTVVGTINTGRPGQLFVVIAEIRKAP